MNAGEPRDDARRGFEAPGHVGDPEVRESRLAVFGEEDVCGFHVTVDDALPVCGLECTSELDPEVQHLVHRQRTVLSDTSVQGALRVVGHHEKRITASRDADFEHGHNVRVAGQTTHRPLFPEESFPILLREIRGQNLDGDGPVERGLRAPVDDAEAAAPDLPGVVESVRTQLRGGRRVHIALGLERIVIGHC